MLNINKSISKRISLSIVAIVAVLFVASFSLFYSFSRRSVTEAAFNHSQQQLLQITAEIDSQLAIIEQSVKDAVFGVSRALDDRQQIVAIINDMLTNNPIIYGSALAFEPYAFDKSEQYFMPYVVRLDSGELELSYFGDVDYDYHVMNWYQIPKLLDKEYWAEPYYDADGSDMIVTTYSQPIYDASGEMVAILTADVSLEWLTELVVNMKPYANSYAVMISRHGYYLAHNDQSLVLNDTFFTHTSELDPTTSTMDAIYELGQAMIAQKQGQTNITIEGNRHYAFYAPIARAGWSVVTASLNRDVMSDLSYITIVVWFILIISLLLILVVTYLVVRRITTPLKEFSKSASIIAQGDFNAPLPNITSQDEVFELREAFSNMQTSLSSYIDELQRSTATKQRIESELAIAQQIQMGMVPKIFPPFPESKHIDIYATIAPAKEVGGDLYDFFMCDNKLIFAIGDVSGKGIPASLLMAVSCSLFRSIAAIEHNPKIIVERINDSICANNDANMFVTMFIAVFDIESGVMEYCNAGHNPPLIISTEGKWSWLEVDPNIPVGVIDQMDFTLQRTTIERGQTIFAYTDGLTEAENFEKELYGESRLCEGVEKQPASLSIAARCNDVLDSLSAFTDGNEQSDDITMLFIQYKDAGES